MKFVGWAVSAGLILAASAASAQTLVPDDASRSPYKAASDFDGPYDPGPPPARQAPGYPDERSYDPGPGYDSAPGYDPRPRYGAEPGYGPGPGYGPPRAPAYGYGPEIIPPQQVYAVLRQSGFSPLGVPHLRGYVYMIAALDRGGEDGRVIIDARSGRILRFVPASRWGSNGGRDMNSIYGSQAALPPPTVIYATPRPPEPVPNVASRTTPLPIAKPSQQPREPAQQSAAVQPKPSVAPPAAPQANGTVGQAKPVPQIQPTQPMPQVQGLE